MICITVFAPGLTSFVSKIDDIAVQVAGLFFDVAEEVDSHAVGVTKQHLTITVHHPDKHRLKKQLDDRRKNRMIQLKELRSYETSSRCFELLVFSNTTSSLSTAKITMNSTMLCLHLGVRHS